ncbi:MAG: DNA polymerase III subunit gamma/tau [Candidatus Obscuribacterales bacterium]|nr:DNA polymerase III subunit gamma/tau [Candidatus Obscuribacterales bacterium]
MSISTYKPLYLKYRPQALDQLVGQASATRTLTNAIENNRLSHAYLFTGPRGTGKTSSARILAKSLNCEKGPTATPCQTCTQCIEIKEGVSPAVFELDAASNNSVDDARTLIERAPLVAVGGRFKLYIIDECHMLTKEAFNALLKTLEEPPSNVVFVLATTEEHKVPQTIVSRCQKLMFRLVSQVELAAYLRQIAEKEGISIEDEALELIARRSGGGLRDALGLLDQASLLSSPEKPVGVNDLLSLLGAMHEDALVSMSAHIMNRDGQKVLSELNALLIEGREPAVLCQEMALHFLNLTKASYVVEAGSVEPAKLGEVVIGSPKYLAAIAELAPKFDRIELAQMIEQLDRLEMTIRRSTQPALHLEMGLLALCHRHEFLMVRELASRVAKLESALQGFEGGVPMLAAAPVAKPVVPTAEPVKAEPVQQVEKPIVAAAAPVVAASEPAPMQVTGNDAIMELEVFWEQLMEYLSTHSMPTHSVLSVHAAPLQLSDSELVVGISAGLQKTVEAKIPHIKNACEALRGKPMSVRVKPMAKDAPRPAAPKPAAREAVTAPSPARQEMSSDDDESGAAGSTSAALRPKMPVSKNEAQPSPAPPPPSASRNAMPEPDEDDKYGTLYQEAYKLFDGPGSRRIG